jgi:tetratricopeptide (TPR) repeat protein
VHIQLSPGELGDSPFLPFAARLVPLLARGAFTAPGLADRIFQDSAAARNIVSSVLEQHPTWSRCLIFIDQLEELFTVVHERYQRPFAALIDSIARHDRVQLVTTLRADFLSRTAEMPELAGWLQKGYYLLIAPVWDALESIIRGPARRSGVQLEDALVARILADTGQEPGRLPLLAYALEQQYCAQKAGQRLTLAGYDSLGGLRGAIGRRAEESFATLEEHAQAALPLLFGELVALDASGTITRRRAIREHIVDKGSRDLAEALIGCRLLSADQSAGKEILEVAHEAIFEGWPRLRSWLDQNREFLLWRERLRFFRSEWERTGRNEAALLHGPLLDEAMRWLNKCEAELTASEKEFILWTDTDEYQITSILPDARDLWPYCDENVRKQWLETLAYAGRFEEIPASADGTAVMSRVAQACAEIGAGRDALLIARRIDDPQVQDVVYYNVANRLADVGDVEKSLEALQQIHRLSMRMNAAFYIGKALAAAGVRDRALAESDKVSESQVREVLVKSLDVGKCIPAKTEYTIEPALSEPTSSPQPAGADTATVPEAARFEPIKPHSRASGHAEECAATLLKTIITLTPDSSGKRGLAARTLRAAEGIASPRDRASYLCDVAAAFLASRSTSPARAVIAKALTVARDLAPPRPIPLLRELTTLLAKTGNTKAVIALLRNGEEPETQAVLLHDLVIMFRAERECRALTPIALAALESTAAIDRTQIKGSVFRDVIPILARSKARAKIAKAIPGVFDSFTKNWFSLREELLMDIAVGLAQAAFADFALSAVKLLNSEWAKSLALRRVAVALAKERLADEALRAASAVEPEQLTSTLHETAVTLARQGLADASRKAASAIADHSSQTQALSETAIALAEFGAVAESITAAEAIDVVEIRDFTLSEIAKVAARLGAGQAAISATTPMTSPAERYAVLRDVGELLGQVNETAIARTSLLQAHEAAKQIVDEMERSDAWSQIALQLARIGFYAEARLSAERCSSLKHRFAAYCGIVREYTLHQRPELGKIVNAFSAINGARTISGG